MASMHTSSNFVIMLELHTRNFYIHSTDFISVTLQYIMLTFNC